MRHLLFCFISILFLSCSAEMNSDKREPPVIQEPAESEKRTSESIHTVQEIELVQDNAGKKEIKAKQEKSVYTLGKYYVISPDGLRMRDSPALSGNVLTTIPYLERVDVLDVNNVKKDTLNKKVLEIGKTIEEDFNLSNFEYNVIGDWIQVQYKDKKGYVFSAYIERGEPRFETIPRYSHAIQLVGRPAGGSGWHAKHISHWYSMIHKEDGFYLEPVSIHYRKDHNLNWRKRPAYVWITPPKKSGLLLGSPKKMSTKKIEPVAQNIKVEFDSLHTVFPMSTKLKKKSEEEFNKLNFSLREIEKHDGIELIIAQGDKTQALKSDYRLEDLWPENISLVADIDQDGELDYLINYFGDKTLGVTFLFLSSEAEPGQLVKDVAYYDRGWPD